MRREVIFIGHGSPINIVLDNKWTKTWRRIGDQIDKPKGIIAISAHWYINNTAINYQEKFKQIYDMYRFPKEVYNIKYNPKNDEELNNKIKKFRRRFNYR